MIVTYIISALILLITVGLIVFVLLRDKAKKKNSGDLTIKNDNTVSVSIEDTSNNNQVKTVYLNKEDNFSGTEFLPIPEKMSNNDFDFEFAGWDKNYVDENGNNVVKAIFIQKPKQMSLFDETLQEFDENNVSNESSDIEDDVKLEIKEQVEYDENVSENEILSDEKNEETQNLENENYENLEDFSDENIGFEELIEEFIASNENDEISENTDNSALDIDEIYEEREVLYSEPIEETYQEEFINTQNNSYPNLNNNFYSKPVEKYQEPIENVNSSVNNNVKIENTDKLFNQINLGRTNSSNFIGTTRSKNGFKVQMNDNYQSYYQPVSSIDVDNKSSMESEDIFKRLGVNMPMNKNGVHYNSSVKIDRNETIPVNTQYNSVMNGPFRSRKMELNRAKFEEMEAEKQKDESKPVEETTTEQFLSGTMMVNRKKISK